MGTQFCSTSQQRYMSAHLIQVCNSSALSHLIPVRLVKFARSGGWWKVAPRIFSSALCSLIALLFLLISSVKGPCDFFLPFRSHNISFILFKDALFRHIRQRHSLHNLKRRLENDAIENKNFCCVFFLHCSSSMDVPRTPT